MSAPGGPNKSQSYPLKVQLKPNAAWNVDQVKAAFSIFNPVSMMPHHNALFVNFNSEEKAIAAFNLLNGKLGGHNILPIQWLSSNTSSEGQATSHQGSSQSGSGSHNHGTASHSPNTTSSACGSSPSKPSNSTVGTMPCSRYMYYYMLNSPEFKQLISKIGNFKLHYEGDSLTFEPQSLASQPKLSEMVTKATKFFSTFASKSFGINKVKPTMVALFREKLKALNFAAQDVFFEFSSDDLGEYMKVTIHLFSTDTTKLEACWEKLQKTFAKHDESEGKLMVEPGSVSDKTLQELSKQHFAIVSFVNAQMDSILVAAVCKADFLAIKDKLQPSKKSTAEHEGKSPAAKPFKSPAKSKAGAHTAGSDKRDKRELNYPKEYQSSVLNIVKKLQHEFKDCKVSMIDGTIYLEGPRFQLSKLQSRYFELSDRMEVTVELFTNVIDGFFLNFLDQKRRDELTRIQADYSGLNSIELVAENKKPGDSVSLFRCVRVSGKRRDVDLAVDDIKELHRSVGAVMKFSMKVCDEWMGSHRRVLREKVKLFAAANDGIASMMHGKTLKSIASVTQTDLFNHSNNEILFFFLSPDRDEAKQFFQKELFKPYSNLPTFEEEFKTNNFKGLCSLLLAPNSSLFAKEIFKQYSVYVELHKDTSRILLFGDRENLDTVKTLLKQSIKPTVSELLKFDDDNLDTKMYLMAKFKWAELTSMAKSNSVYIIQEPNLALSGSQSAIATARKQILSHLQGLSVFSNQIDVHPGIRKLLNHRAIKLEQQYQVRLKYGSSKEESKLLLTLTLDTGLTPVTVEIARGNIIREKTAAIVNPANSDLQHAGGAALDISQAAGLKYDQECKHYIGVHGKLETGKAFACTSGKLSPNIQKIINTVGPIGYNSRADADLLKSAIRNSLLVAEKENLSSISFPAISSGIYGFPLVYCARLFFLTLLECFDPLSSFSHISLIRLVNVDQKTAQVFQTAATEFIQIQQNSPPLYAPLLAAVKVWCNASSSAAMCGSQPALSDSATPLHKLSAAVSHQWSRYEWESKSWIAYDVDQNNQIEAAYLRKDPEVVIIGDLGQVKNGNTYCVNFAKMKQKNVKSGYERELKREAMNNTNPSTIIPLELLAPPPMSTSEERRRSDSRSGKNPSLRMTVTVHGLSTDSVLSACNAVKALETNSIASESMNLLYPLTEALVAELQHLVIAENVSIQYQPSSSSPKLDMRGSKDAMDRAFRKIHTALQSPEFAQQAGSMLNSGQQKYPDDWTPLSNPDSQVEKFDVDPASREYQMIIGRARETMPSVNIIKIERIQNLWLWKKYCAAKANLQLKYDKFSNKAELLNERLLFHGTRGSSPECIYLDEFGFDMRYCTQGMWGRGIYFATNASYSNSYAFKTDDGNNQFFLASVLCGKVKDLLPDGTLTLPPVDEHSQGTIRMRYDTVSGTTGGSLNYVVYENGRAYPSYLITFK